MSQAFAEIEFATPTGPRRAESVGRSNASLVRGVAFELRCRLRLPALRGLAMRNSIDEFLEHPRLQPQGLKT